MAYFTALALLLFAGACHGGQRIIDGVPTTIERFPYIVQVDRLSPHTHRWSQICAANILNELYVLSAAHCFESTAYEPNYHPSNRRIRAGSTWRNAGGRLVYIVREYNHPEYRVAARFDADISVIRLSSFMAFNSVIQPVGLVSESSFVPDNTPVVHAGWGVTEHGTQPLQLLKVQIYTVNNDECRTRYFNHREGTVTPNMICAGVLDVAGRDACQGDSGGPLYYGDSNTLIGVISWGSDCGHVALPGVSTAVIPYAAWIQSIVR